MNKGRRTFYFATQIKCPWLLAPPLLFVLWVVIVNVLPADSLVTKTLPKPAPGFCVAAGDISELFTFAETILTPFPVSAHPKAITVQSEGAV